MNIQIQSSKPDQLRLTAALLAIFLAAGLYPAFGAGVKSLPGHVPEVEKHLTPKGDLPATNELRLAIGVPLRDPAGLGRFLAELYDPASPIYRHYLTPDEFAARFAATETDYAAVKQFALASGFKITAEHGNRLLLDVTGRVADVERAFHFHLREYQHPTEAREFFAPDAEPTVDAGLAVVDIEGLSDYIKPHPKSVKPAAVNAIPNAGSSPGGGTSYFGDDFRSAYVPGTTLTGAGQSVGVVELLSIFYTNDIAAYAAAAGGGRTNILVQTVSLDSYTGTPDKDNRECSLDIEMAMAMAPGLSRILVFEGSAPNDILSAMAASNTVKNLSCSYGFGFGPSVTTDGIFQQMSAEGQSFFNAVGDTDAFTSGSDADNDQSTSPYITQVGGTALTTSSNGTYASETVWNNGGGTGSSGGYSAYYAIPSWQTNLSMTANQGSKTMRNVPDVALTAANIYITDGDGGSEVVGGTSCAAPLWAGFMALVNQAAAAVGNPAGFINPAVYAIGNGTNYNHDFHDITTGNNCWPSSPANFPAVTGYDLCTGWGTPNGTNLINALAVRILPPVITGTGMSARGGFTLNGRGGAGLTNILLTASNLLSPAWKWTPIATNIANTNGVFNFTDAQATNCPQRFYRVTTP